MRFIYEFMDSRNKTDGITEECIIYASSSAFAAAPLSCCQWRVSLSHLCHGEPFFFFFSFSANTRTYLDQNLKLIIIRLVTAFSLSANEIFLEQYSDLNNIVLLDQFHVQFRYVFFDKGKLQERFDTLVSK